MSCATSPPPKLEAVLTQSRQFGKPVVLEFFTTRCIGGGQGIATVIERV